MGNSLNVPIPFPLDKGGTGAITATAAFDNLSPVTTEGDIIYRDASNNVRLAKGTADQILTMNAGATAPEWQTAGTYSLPADLQSITDNTGTAADKAIYYTATNVAAEFDLTAAGRAILDDANNTAQRTTLGLGTMATQDANGVSISGGTVVGITDLVVADGGTGVSTLAIHGLLVGNGVNDLTVLAVGTTGKVLTGNTGADPTWEDPAGAGLYAYDLVLVAGGGGGASRNGAGGGAGGFLSSSSYLIIGSIYSIIIGAGGTASTGIDTVAGNGNDSSFSFTTVNGGGGGSSFSNSSPSNGGDGGSGGGGGGTDSGGANLGGSGTAGQGYDGGDGSIISTNNGGGGGGGASEVGSDAVSDTTAGDGGDGVASSITGSSVTYAGGGGGGGDGSAAGSGGTGGGGDGGLGASPSGQSGTVNTGGGGGGGGQATSLGGNGGSGVIIIRVLTTDYSGTTTGSPTVTTDGSYTVIKYTSSGTYTA